MIGNLGDVVEAFRLAELVKQAQALEESFVAEEAAERQRAKLEEATKSADILVPATIKKREVETLAEAEAERVRRTRQGEADGLRAVMEAEAEGLRAILTRKAEGFDQIVGAARGLPEMASLLLVTEQLPKLVEEQVKAISNLKIDKITVWDNGGGDGEGSTAGFLRSMIGSLPPVHELAEQAGMELPEFLGTLMNGTGAAARPIKSKTSPPKPTGGGGETKEK